MNKSCMHCKEKHPDPSTCGGAEKCTMDICECEKFIPNSNKGQHLSITNFYFRW